VCIKFCVKNGFKDLENVGKVFRQWCSKKNSGLPVTPRPKKPRRFQSKKKVMLTVFMDYNSVVHHEFLPKNQIVNKEYYLGVMRRLREAIRLKRKDLWANISWILHQDNAPSHNAIIIREFLTKNVTNTIPQSPNSLDLAPCDFFLFDQLKKPLRGTRFSSREEIIQKSKTLMEYTYRKSSITNVLRTGSSA